MSWIAVFAHWFWAFIKDGWNIFDVIVVTISVVSRLFSQVPGLNTLRLLRAFRVLRLFGRLASLREPPPSHLHTFLPRAVQDLVPVKQMITRPSICCRQQRAV